MSVPPFSLETAILIDLDRISTNLMAEKFAYSGADPATVNSPEERQLAIGRLLFLGLINKKPSRDPDVLLRTKYLTPKGEKFLDRLKFSDWHNFDLFESWEAVLISDLLLELEKHQGSVPRGTSLEVAWAPRGGLCSPQKQKRIVRAAYLGLVDSDFANTDRGNQLVGHVIRKHGATNLKRFLNELYSSEASLDYPRLASGLDIFKQHLTLKDAAPILTGVRDWVAEALKTRGSYKTQERSDYLQAFFQAYFTSLHLKKLEGSCTCKDLTKPD
jgi:hypothetical protein